MFSKEMFTHSLNIFEHVHIYESKNHLKKCRRWVLCIYRKEWCVDLCVQQQQLLPGIICGTEHFFGYNRVAKKLNLSAEPAGL